MRTLLALASALALAACGDVALDTDVAGTRDFREAMVRSIVIGRTTDGEVRLRWGAPVQIDREGAEERWIYRDMTSRVGVVGVPVGAGRSASYVIVSFQYGIATRVTTSESEGCRGSFLPRPPGPGFPNPTTVHRVGDCRLAATGFANLDPNGRLGPQDGFAGEVPK